MLNLAYPSRWGQCAGPLTGLSSRKPHTPASGLDKRCGLSARNTAEKAAMTIREKKWKYGVLWGLLLSLVIGGSAPLYAQAYTATLEGLISDSSGAVVPKATVKLTNEATNVTQTKVTDERGRYIFTFLPPASYKLEVEMKGFQTFVRSGMVLQVQQAARVDVTLTPGEVATQVEVTGEAPRLDAVNATLGRVVSNNSILDMPVGRNPLALATLAPGVVGVGGNPSGDVNFVSNGARNSQSDVLIDGVSVTNQEHNSGITVVSFTPRVEAVQEFKVQTNSFSAEYGMTGSTVINMVTRSGGNDIHGSLFEFHADNKLNANNYFSNASGGQIAKFRTNQFGGAVGGPVYIPKVYDGRNRTFFFFHHEKIRSPGGAEERDTVPTVLEKNGDFSQTFNSAGQPISIFDPNSVHQDASGNWVRNAFAGNIVPKSAWSPVATKVLAFYPDPNLPGQTAAHIGNFFKQGSSHYSWYQQNVKVDHNFNPNQRLSVRYSREVGTSGNDNNMWGEGNYMVPSNYNRGISRPQNGVADYTHILNPTTILSLRAGIARLYADSGRIDHPGTGFDEKTLGFTGPLDVQQAPAFYPDGYTMLGPSQWQHIRRAETNTHFIGSVTKMAGIHSFKAGGEARVLMLNYGQPGFNAMGIYFNRNETMQNPLSANSLQGNALASFMTGWMGSGSQGTDAYTAVASHTYAFYANDDIRLTPRLTVSLGLRWELPRPATERFNRFDWIDLNMKSPLNVPGYPNLKGGYVYTDANNRTSYDADTRDLAPRVGFAYQFASHMVLRGGYGIYYGIPSYQNTAELADGYTTSTSITPSVDGGVHQFRTLAAPFGSSGPLKPVGSSVGALFDVGNVIYGPVRDWGRAPQYQQWSLSVQRELPANSVVELVYTGSKGTHLGFGNMRRQPNYMSSAQALSLGDGLYTMVDNPFYGYITDPNSALSQPKVTRQTLLRPYPQYAAIAGRPGPPIGNSVYHAGQIKFTKRMTHGLSMTAHYTWSKMINDSESADDPNLDWLYSAAGGRPRPQVWDNLRLERAVSLFDINHRFIADFNYALPFGRRGSIGSGMNKILDGFVGGWQVNGILTEQTGQPLVPTLSGAKTIEAGATQRPNLLSDPSMPGSAGDKLTKYLNPAAFSRPSTYAWGTAPRTLTSVRAPGLHNINVSLFKHFYLNEKGDRYFELRGEATNFTNTVRFGIPNSQVGSSGFGVISSQVNGPRNVTLGAKLYF